MLLMKKLLCAITFVALLPHVAKKKVRIQMTICHLEM